MVVNLYVLKQVLKRVLLEFDHKHLNLDTPYFTATIPTTENIAGVLWGVLAAHTEIGRLQNIRLFEEEDLYADVTAESFSKEDKLARASLTRRYHFPAAHHVSEPYWADAGQSESAGICRAPDLHGHNYALQVTISGPVNSGTGMVTDLASLDRVVHKRVIGRFGYRNLNMDPDLAQGLTTGINIARFIWMLLQDSIPGGQLVKVGLTETADISYEYEGAASR
jgi:6-pyruvoyltetrahydropterin/6-carboxytetrahydropterin synthase